jgi:hypothetical protein
LSNTTAKDTSVLSSSPDTNYGSNKSSGVTDAAGAIVRTYFTLDLSEFVGVGSRIRKAYLSLYSLTATNKGGTFTFYRLEDDIVQDEATWNNKTVGTAWDDAGGDFEVEDSDSSNVSGPFAIPSALTRVDYDITTLVKDAWDSQESQLRILMKATEETGADDVVTFGSTDHGTNSSRPILKVTHVTLREQLWRELKINYHSGIATGHTGTSTFSNERELSERVNAELDDLESADVLRWYDTILDDIAEESYNKAKDNTINSVVAMLLGVTKQGSSGEYVTQSHKSGENAVQFPEAFGWFYPSPAQSDQSGAQSDA